MARAAKVFITTLGFYELAVAAPSMTAALKAWGLEHNAFHQGLAKETKDAAIVAAASAAPGVVVRRPIGGRGFFKAEPDAARAPAGSKTKKHSPKTKQADPAKVKAAEESLRRARVLYEKRRDALNSRLAGLQDQISGEDDAWQSQREKLEAQIAKAKKPG